MVFFYVVALVAVFCFPIDVAFLPFSFFALANEMMQPLMYALAQSHRMKGDLSGEVFICRQSLCSVVTNIIHFPR